MRGAELLDWIGNLPDDAYSAVCQSMRQILVPPNFLLQHRGEMPTGLYRVVSGRVRIYYLTECGREVLFKICTRNESFGDLSAADGDPYQLYAQTLTDCELQFLSRSSLTQLRSKFPAIESGLLDYSLRLSRTLIEFVAEATAFSLRSRVMSRLSWLAAAERLKGQNSGTISISQQEFCLMVGASRQAVNRVITELQSVGALRTRYGRIEILRADLLNELNPKLSPIKNNLHHTAVN